MASSSNPSKRPRDASGSQDTQAHLDLNRLFTTQNELQRYSTKFSHRVLVPHHYMLFDEMRRNNFQFQEFYAFQGLQTLMELKCSYYPILTQAFYCNLCFNRDRHLQFKIGGSLYTITPEVWKTVFDLDTEGISLARSGDDLADYSKTEALNEMLVNPNDQHSYLYLTAGRLKVEYRLLHYALVRIVDVRTGNYARLNDDDVLLMWALSKKIKVNWPVYLAEKMARVSTKEGAALPFACMIASFLRHFDIPTSLDVSIQTSTANLFGSLTLAKMDIIQETDGTWRYRKDRSDGSQPQVGSSSGAPPPPASAFTESAPSWFTDGISELKMSNAALEQSVNLRFDTVNERLDSLSFDFDLLRGEVQSRLPRSAPYDPTSSTPEEWDG